MPAAHSSAGLEIVTPSPPEVGTPRSQAAPTAAGDGGQPAPARSKNSEATNGIAGKQNVRARMVGLWHGGLAMRAPRVARVISTPYIARSATRLAPPATSVGGGRRRAQARNPMSRFTTEPKLSTSVNFTAPLVT